jgi:hypothetical protein
MFYAIFLPLSLPQVNQISDLLDMFFMRDGMVPLNNYTSFWGRLEDPSLATFIVVALVAKLVAMGEGGWQWRGGSGRLELVQLRVF